MGLTITALYAGLLALVLMGLSIWVITNRGRHKVGIGDGGNAEMARAMRVQGNFIEYVPLCLILIAVLETTKASAYGLHALGIILVLSRLLHALGLASSPGTSFGRFVGTVGTFVVLLGGGVWSISRFLMA